MTDKQEPLHKRIERSMKTQEQLDREEFWRNFRAEYLYPGIAAVLWIVTIAGWFLS